jgi:hypothetical protein
MRLSHVQLVVFFPDGYTLHHNSTTGAHSHAYVWKRARLFSITALWAKNTACSPRTPPCQSTPRSDAQTRHFVMRL